MLISCENDNLKAIYDTDKKSWTPDFGEQWRSNAFYYEESTYSGVSDSFNLRNINHYKALSSLT